MNNIILSKYLKELAKIVDEKIEFITGERRGFALVIFTNEPGEETQYIANCDREEVSKAFMAMLSKWYKDMPDIKAHEKH